MNGLFELCIAWTIAVVLIEFAGAWAMWEE